MCEFYAIATTGKMQTVLNSLSAVDRIWSTVTVCEREQLYKVTTL